jgi:PAS domain S-box-containing protein
VHKHHSGNKEIYLEVTKIPLYDSQSQIIGLVGINRDVTERKHAEEALLESEAKYRILTEYMTDVVWQLSPDMVYIYLSPSFTQLTGFKTTDFLGKPIWSLFTKESSEYLQELALKRKLMPFEERKKSLVFEASLYDADKKLVWNEIVSNPVFNETGELLFFQGMSRDITQRKMAELALKESQEKLGVVIANAPMVLFQIDKEGIFRFSDGKGLEKLGLKSGQVVGLSAFEVYKDMPVICEQIREALAGKIVADVININNIFFEILYNPVMDFEGKTTSVIGIAFDITERMLAQIALQESEHRFKTLFREMTEGVALHELLFDKDNKPFDYRILEVNPAYSFHTGLDAKNISNQLASDFYGTGNPPYLNEFSSVVVNAAKYKFETFFEQLEKFFKISAIPIGPAKFATVFEDVTVQKKHEKELRDKNDELERFTYTVSHDLKSPLVTIKGFIGMLEQDLKHNHQENITDDIQRIKSATDKMTDLLNDLLELSRVGRKINPPVKISMYSIVSEALELLSGTITENSVSVEVDKNLPEVYVDKQRMVEVWLNLVENAVKFSSKLEKPQIKIDCIKEDSKFIFNIRDNGIGIDKKYHSTIFGLFNKLDNKTLGTGIGLALVKRIIDVHGGEIWVESEGPGKGAKFSFSVPIKMFKRNETSKQ